MSCSDVNCRKGGCGTEPGRPADGPAGGRAPARS